MVGTLPSAGSRISWCGCRPSGGAHLIYAHIYIYEIKFCSVCSNQECDIVYALKEENDILCVAYNYPRVVAMATNTSTDVFVLQKGNMWKIKTWILFSNVYIILRKTSFSATNIYIICNTSMSSYKCTEFFRNYTKLVRLKDLAFYFLVLILTY